METQTEFEKALEWAAQTHADKMPGSEDARRYSAADFMAGVEWHLAWLAGEMETCYSSLHRRNKKKSAR